MTLLFGFAPSPDFAENLRNAMFIKGCKAVDVARATKITPSVISRYLTGAHQPSTDNLLVISKKYLGISPEALLSSSEAPSTISSSDKDKVIAVQEVLIKNLQKQVGGLEKQVKEWEEAIAESKVLHAKGKAKADLAISRHKNTLRIKTTRKRKK